jgi:hypothetical protein
MIAKYLVPAVAVIGSAAGKLLAPPDLTKVGFRSSPYGSLLTYVVAIAQCTSATATINSNAQATQLAGQCKTFNGNILVSTDATGTIDFSGLGQVKGDFIAESAGALNELTSTTLNSITGVFHLRNLTALASLRFPSLDSVGSIDWQSLSVLDKLTFGTPGITKATDIKISDTFLSSLDGIDVQSLRSLDLNNNFRLETLNSPLTNLSWTMNFLANHREMKVSFPSLTWAANMTISNVTTFELPALQTVNGSAIFTSNKAVSFAAPNVTSVGTINFISNNNLKNISFPQLASIAGGIVIANNTLLPKIDGFPKLKTIGGDVKLRGNFSE